MKNVIVTGGSRGLGLGITQKLAETHRVIPIARSESQELSKIIHAMSEHSETSIKFRAFDLSNTDGLPELVSSIRKEFGPIFALINNAAIGTSGILATMQNSTIERTIRLNTFSPIILTKYVVRSMMKDGGGKIVNITSIVGSTGFSGLSVYGATKASIIGLTKSLARELGPMKINVNAIAPGFVDTDMTNEISAEHRGQILRRSPLGRLAEVSDIANAVKFLISDSARNVTGSVLTIDAGSTI